MCVCVLRVFVVYICVGVFVRGVFLPFVMCMVVLRCVFCCVCCVVCLCVCVLSMALFFCLETLHLQKANK